MRVTSADDKRRRGPQLVSRPQVLQVIVDRFCDNPSMPTVRADLIEHLRVSTKIINDHVKGLMDEGKIRLTTPGHFVPTQIRPDRAQSLTRIPGADAKWEMGEHCVDFSPGELRTLAQLAGYVSRDDIRRELLAMREELGL